MRLKSAWVSFKGITENFLGNHQSLDYEELVNGLLDNYQSLGCLRSVKLHFSSRSESNGEKVPRRVGCKYDGGLLLDVKKRK